MRVRIDVGANIGDTSVPWMSESDIEVYAFEPDPRMFSVLKKHQSSRYHVFNQAISSEEGRLNFFQSVDTSCSSLLPYTDEGIKRWISPVGRVHSTLGVIQVDTVTLSRVFEENHLEKVDYLKIDAQGHDFEVVKSAGEYLRNIREVMLEVQVTDFELYKGSSKIKDVLDYMKSYEFIEIRREANTGDQEYNITFLNAVV